MESLPNQIPLPRIQKIAVCNTATLIVAPRLSSSYTYVTGRIKRREGTQVLTLALQERFHNKRELYMYSQASTVGPSRYTCNPQWAAITRISKNPRFELSHGSLNFN